MHGRCEAGTSIRSHQAKVLYQMKNRVLFGPARLSQVRVHGPSAHKPNLNYSVARSRSGLRRSKASKPNSVVKFTMVMFHSDLISFSKSCPPSAPTNTWHMLANAYGLIDYSPVMDLSCCCFGPSRCFSAIRLFAFQVDLLRAFR
jgi:hypothetical protein